jgi:single-strand DNA-binding protein
MSNRFQGVGNLGAKPSFKHVGQNGDSLAILECRIYFDRRVPTEKEGEFEDLGGFWISASLFGPRAEAAAQLLDKGMRVFAAGTLVTDSWVDSNSDEARVEMRLRLDYLALDLSRVESVRMAPKRTQDGE